MRRWDAGEDDRAQGALAARVRAVWKSKVHGAFVLNRRVDLHAIDATLVDFHTGPRCALAAPVALAGRARGLFFY